jgi:hypothetical protein
VSATDVTATEIAAGRNLVVRSSEAQPMLLLPSARSCPLGDIYARALAGAAVVALPSGGLLIAGGTGDDGAVRSEVLTLAPGAILVEQVPKGMLLRRAFATATLVSSLVVIAGGAGDTRGGAQYTYEVFDTDSASIVGSRSGQLLTGARMQHAALALADGSLLLVGGRAEIDGAPLDSAERIDLVAGTAEAISGGAGLSEARVSPALLMLDSGSVIVLGGRDANGQVLGSVERFDTTQHDFTRLPIALPVHAELVAAALPGARVAWLGCEVGAAASCELGLLIENAGAFVSERVALDFRSSAPQGLSELQLVALDGGRLLLTAADDSDPNTRRRAFVIDLNVPSLAPVEASRVPSQLLVLRTGQIAELDAAGASLREYASLSDYESPDGNLITETLALLDLDAASHWSRDAAGLHALVLGARVDVPKLRFDAFQVQLDAVGDASLSFVTDSGDRFGVELRAGRVLSQGCDVALPEGAQLVAARDSNQLSVRTDSGARLCQVSTPTGFVHINVQAALGTLLRALTLQRR